tara:strand:- start:201 stop:374 length:174 start_codon:yes stop_codon:yes gene_type:complete
MTIIARVKKILERSSGTFRLFLKAEIMSFGKKETVSEIYLQPDRLSGDQPTVIEEEE